MDQKQEDGSTQEANPLQVFGAVLASQTKVTIEVYTDMWAWQQVFIEAIDENLNAHGKEQELEVDREYMYALIIWVHQVTLEPPVAKAPAPPATVHRQYLPLWATGTNTIENLAITD